MEGIIGLLILAADVYAIVKIFESPAETLVKVGWIVAVLILPVIGLIAWYLFGPGGRGG